MSEPSPESRALLYIEDIISYSRHAIDFLGSQSDAELGEDLKAQFAILRAIEIVGEAAKSIPDEVRLLAPEVPWKDVVAMRNRIAHHYFGVNLDVVINAVRQDLRPLILSMERLLVELRDGLSK